MQDTQKSKIPKIPRYPKTQDTQISVTWFDDIRAVKQRPSAMTWATFTALTCRPPTAECKRDLRWIKLAKFGDQRSKKGCYRHDKNVLALTGVELDYDDAALSFEIAIAVLSEMKMRCVLHTTPSHTEDTPRYRVLVPFDAPVTGDTDWLKEVRRHYIDFISGLIGRPANESYALSQAYYFGRVTGVPYHHAIVQGKCVDTQKFPQRVGILDGVGPFIRPPASLMGVA